MSACSRTWRALSGTMVEIPPARTARRVMVDGEKRSPVSADGVSGKYSKGSFDVGRSMVVVCAISSAGGQDRVQVVIVCF